MLEDIIKELKNKIDELCIDNELCKEQWLLDRIEGEIEGINVTIKLIKDKYL